ncbi:tRNA lysidine(34) synthetase TilS [Pontiella agarivorans]|uniref:tRNA(Ile)-lysidine synthase n=1 Tax=Pontiella agarivorans TaxID=3038953 RepID=A0ABU5MXA0_9BACT|nr:tRNA lysidine(34) synthetase TilS [Pontiella agarivorans]MDZ8118835.1 tRNA lysidine(34) synthetase TilS [Pontiella agarivorans]
MNLPSLINKKIEAHQIRSCEADIVIGVSGGADSTALVRIFSILKVPCTLAHLNHQLRGAESDADEAFVRKLAKDTGFPVVVKSVDVETLAAETGQSIEMAARQARHAFFAEFGHAVIVLAHHADDQAETFILKLARGAGPAGLCGMPVFQTLEQLRIFRPMLDVPRSDIVQWLEENKFSWREDASNADEHFLRNRVRHRILPLLERELNPGIRDTILRTMDILRAENEWMEEAVNDAQWPINHLPLALRRRYIRAWLFNQGAEEAGFETIDRILQLLKNTSGTAIYELNDRQRVIIEYGKPRFEERGSPAPKILWEISTRSANGWTRDNSRIGDARAEAAVSARKLGGRPVEVRMIRPGDRIAPLGMEGSRKLQDILTDLKIPRAQRKQLPVVVCQDEIIWVPGYRIARGWAVENPNASSVLLKIEQKVD